MADFMLAFGIYTSAWKRSRLRRIWRAVCLLVQRGKDRATLRSLSPLDISDFCPKHAEAEAEMSKPFWRE